VGKVICSCTKADRSSDLKEGPQACRGTLKMVKEKRVTCVVKYKYA